MPRKGVDRLQPQPGAEPQQRIEPDLPHLDGVCSEIPIWRANAERLPLSRERSPKTPATAGIGLAFGSPQAVKAHLARYRRALMGPPNIDPRHRNEFWDLTWLCENGTDEPRISDDDGALRAEWYGYIFQLEGHWRTSV